MPILRATVRPLQLLSKRILISPFRRLCPNQRQPRARERVGPASPSLEEAHLLVHGDAPGQHRSPAHGESLGRRTCRGSRDLHVDLLDLVAFVTSDFRHDGSSVPAGGNDVEHLLLSVGVAGRIYVIGQLLSVSYYYAPY